MDHRTLFAARAIDAMNEFEELDRLRAASSRVPAHVGLGSVAFYWRVSTEDNQDPEASRQRQLHRAIELIKPLGGHVVREYSDIGVSRSLPWTARPAARELLKDLKNPLRGFSAVVVGEGDRSFFGDQLNLIWPQFEIAGVGLYIPDIGGRYDPRQLLGKTLMTIVGLLSEHEIDTVRRRVRETMARSVVNDGKFMGGRTPYGYRVVDTEIPHRHPRKAAEGHMVRELEVDPEASPIVQEIFRMYLSGMGHRAIAAKLNEDGTPCPSAHNPGQNAHRPATGWQHTVIAAILDNVRYTGY
jgi:DNA invertase Pin-like site-specific DNA recombinase